jgi:hypothetical protein
LLNIGPLPLLYWHLIPSNKKRLKKPPLIHYGYVAEKEFLIGYARRHGLLRECPGEYEGEIVLLELDTMYDSVKAILIELQISSIPVRLPFVVTKDGTTRIIALHNNYSMDRIPPNEDVENLARLLDQEEEGHKWYFDATKWKWR